ncbi:ML domain-containing protein [Mycena indigotica]|uniref:Phosphatidylglycerol/phosphatidylinositol transfer protein n=1 Tax=Mycena indigotica TaxID=2126181 RepID=A0A8H6VVV8_9AGAR|nr:ML domain-containing protein [Mycena indigotica]KAF7290154.1 ML domain-containing protein [Mycena indigotica]
MQLAIPIFSALLVALAHNAAATTPQTPLQYRPSSCSPTGLELGGAKALSEWSWVDCGTETDVVHLRSLDISPDPPVPGKELTVKVNGTVERRVEDGAWVDVVVKIGVIKLLARKFDICEEAENANATVQCPVEKGEYAVTQSFDLPKEIPPGKFTVLLRGYTVEDEPMFCLDIVADFRHRK